MCVCVYKIFNNVHKSTWNMIANKWGYDATNNGLIMMVLLNERDNDADI